MASVPRDIRHFNTLVCCNVIFVWCKLRNYSEVVFVINDHWWGFDLVFFAVLWATMSKNRGDFALNRVTARRAKFVVNGCMATSIWNSFILTALCQVALTCCQRSRCVQLFSFVVKVVCASRKTDWVRRVVPLLQSILCIKGVHVIIVQISWLVLCIVLVPKGVRSGTSIDASIVRVKLVIARVFGCLHSMLLFHEATTTAQYHAYWYGGEEGESETGPHYNEKSVISGLHPINFNSSIVRDRRFFSYNVY